MFDIGALELVLIGVVTLLVVGPERLPKVARTAGLWLGRGRRAFLAVKEEIDREIKAEELKEILRKQAESNPLESIIEDTGGLRPTPKGATSGGVAGQSGGQSAAKAAVEAASGPRADAGTVSAQAKTSTGTAKPGPAKPEPAKPEPAKPEAAKSGASAEDLR